MYEATLAAVVLDEGNLALAQGSHAEQALQLTQPRQGCR